MNVYLGKDRQWAAQHLTLTNLTRGVERFGYKLYMANFFSSPDLFDDMAQKKFPVVGQKKGMPKNLKTLDTEIETWWHSSKGQGVT